MIYCGYCQARLKPISPRLREDVLSITRPENKRLLLKLGRTCLVVITVLSFWGYAEIKRNVVDTVQKEVIPRLTDSADTVLKSKVQQAVDDATKAMVPEFQSLLRLVQRKHETELHESLKRSQTELQQVLQQSQNAMRVTTQIAERQVTDAAENAAIQISTTRNALTVPSGQPSQTTLSGTDQTLAGIVRVDSDRLKNLYFNESLRTLDTLQTSKFGADLRSIPLSSVIESPCHYETTLILKEKGIVGVSDLLNCSKVPQNFSDLLPREASHIGGLPALPLSNTKY
jgi:hypothetical protein